MQSNLARALVALAALVVIVVAFVVLSDGGGSGSDSPAAPAGEEKRASRPAESDDGAEASSPSRVETVVLRDGEPQGGVVQLEFDKGEEVRFAVRSDVADQIHVHGYDVEEEVPAGGRVEFRFPADIDGVFEVESHEAEAQVAELTVAP